MRESLEKKQEHNLEQAFGQLNCTFMPMNTNQNQRRECSSSQNSFRISTQNREFRPKHSERILHQKKDGKQLSPSLLDYSLSN